MNNRDETPYIIRGSEDGEPVWWSNTNGWVAPADQATRFTADERAVFQKPFGGQWEELVTVEDRWSTPEHSTAPLNTVTYPSDPAVEAILAAEPISTVTEVLYGWEEEISTAVRALLFGTMVRRAIGVTEHYLSDLYHDARFLDDHVHGACEFLFMVREWGTDIGSNVKAQMAINPVPTSEKRIAYRVTLSVDGGQWSVTYDELAYGGSPRPTR